MFAGHFGVAAIVKTKEPKVPLWALIVATQLLDILFLPLFLLGVETMDQIGDGPGEVIIRADYTHSLIGAVAISWLAGLAARRLWGSSGGKVIGVTAFSHWILDIVVHRMDMAILPGNLGDLPLLGFGLWRWPVVSVTLEAALVIVGSMYYFRYALDRADSSSGKRPKTKAILGGGALAGFMVLALVSDFL